MVALPRVIVHNAVSVDGRVDWFAPDVGLFYGLAARWQEDATLAGSETILAAMEMDETEHSGDHEPDSGAHPNDSPHAHQPVTVDSGHAVAEAQPADDGVRSGARPLLAVVDSRGRVRNWGWWRAQPHWRDAVVLCSRSTPREHLDRLAREGVDTIIAGEDRVDLREALTLLAARHGVRVLRVDSGGTLNGALLRAGLVDEVSVLVHPELVGGTNPRSLFRAADLTSSAGVIPLRLTAVERLERDIVWLRYEVVRSAS